MKTSKLRAPTLKEIKLASKQISCKAIRTPLIKLNWQTDNDTEIFLKLENLQPIASFKVPVFIVHFIPHEQC